MYINVEEAIAILEDISNRAFEQGKTQEFLVVKADEFARGIKAVARAWKKLNQLNDELTNSNTRIRNRCVTAEFAIEDLLRGNNNPCSYCQMSEECDGVQFGHLCRTTASWCGPREDNN